MDKINDISDKIDYKKVIRIANKNDVKRYLNNINDKNIVIVDCRFNLMDKEYGKKSYEKKCCYIFKRK